ncbi:MAG: hypothetical protein ABI304_09820 [Rudaea sp.]
MSSGNCPRSVDSVCGLLGVGVGPGLAGPGVTTTGAGANRGMIGNGKLDINTGAGFAGLAATGVVGRATGVLSTGVAAILAGVA